MRNNRFRITLFVLLLLPGLVFEASARQDIKAEKRALIKELFEVTKVGSLAQTTTDAMLNRMEASVPQMISQIIDSAPELKRRADLQKSMDESRIRILRRTRELMAERMNLAEITEQMFYPLYDKYFSEDELRGLISFYRSPVGQKAVDVLPALMQEAINRASELILPKLTPIMTQVMEEEKQHWIKPVRKR